ncbi:hypothetical protein D1007_20404 [Hordeum vulgare]|nr:hypothetical protein D1007_20404 [Hordeum vulgare]
MSHLQLPNDTEASQFFRASTTSTLSDDTACRLWVDPCPEGSSISLLAPALVALVPARKRRTLTVATDLLDRTWITHIQGPPGSAAILEYVEIRRKLQRVPSSCYIAFFTGSTTSEHSQLVWQSGSPLSFRFFLYLASVNRCWFADRLACRVLPHEPACVLCLLEPETL